MTPDESGENASPETFAAAEPIPASPLEAAQSIAQARAHFHEAIAMLACAAQATDQQPESAPNLAHTALRFILDGIDALEHAAAHNLPCAGSA
ncbi:MAG: hypothetical protein JWM36_4731 [Hyphomicrobiales bacterium]|nr:hypothetical protein [Hyphomicrobiales bacterium]